MTAITLSELSVVELPCDNLYGTHPRRRVQIFVRGTSAATTDTLALATYVSGLSAISGIHMEMLDGAKNAGTANTWSTTTITFAGHAGSGLWNLGVIGTLT